ncbi:fimbrial protein [Citrobacter sedlakii]|uniref:fimbrial protein n=1 Tax=Citrobacter sedlakii TaxID=67826 RepID=UPI001BA4F393|nr:fimbrial protein [Citrobacter sedlakii]EKJ8220211.1 fimbrial protein [Citrobacter sedlakii]QUC30707.1 fimbrial protein [Citrobacter sedlakii]
MKKILLGFLLSSFTLSAAENLQFSGTLIAPPTCTVNNEETIEIGFGDVAIEKIDGVNYTTLIGLNVYCNYPGRNHQMTLTIGGAISDFNPAAIETDVDGLGVEIKQNGQPFTINDVLSVEELTFPLLEAVPVKKSGASLKDGSFEAWATIKVEYQ